MLNGTGGLLDRLPCREVAQSAARHFPEFYVSLNYVIRKWASVGYQTP